jgi:LPXTG-site transpeptidase (sortase) family protein
MQERRHNLSRTIKPISTLALVSVFLAFGYLAWYNFSPYWPAVEYRLQHLFSTRTPVTTDNLTPDPRVETLGTNSLLIPGIDVEAKILQLKSIDQLYDNSWILPWGSTPEKGGNTVIVAHRYLRRNQTSEEDIKTFYNLPTMKAGDLVYLNYKGKKYEYQVFETMEVGIKDIWIEDNTADPMLTLYTCTPLWTSDRRFVVRAKLLKEF